MKHKFRLVGAAVLLLTANLAFSLSLPNNFWPNSSFESGTNLDAPDGSGTPTGWVRNGSDTNIDQVTPVLLNDSTNAIMVNDNDPNNYGEWDSYISLAGLVQAGDTINIQYLQMYSIQGGEMRVAVVFLDVDNNPISAGQFVVSGDSPGWQGSIATSTFTQTNQSLVVPIGAMTLSVGIVSGGAVATTGLLVVDDLYLARAPVPAVLTNNIWPNSSFESGTNLDLANGTPAGWVRNGSDPTICQVTTNNYVSTDHALMVNHSGSIPHYGEWGSDLVLPANASPGAALNVQWFELYSVTNGQMRLTLSFLGSTNNYIQSTDFKTTSDNSAGWQGAIVGSGFTRRNEQVLVPPGAVKLRAALVSGGPETTFGVMLIDDLSVAVAAVAPPPVALLTNNFWPNPRFELGSNLDQTHGTPDGWVRNGTDPAICQVITNNFTSPTHALAVIDNGTNYGEWDADLVLSSTNASALELIDIQYSQLYSVTNGPMRLSVLFFDANSNVVRQTDFNVAGQSSGWQGTIASSTFSLQSQQVLVPPGSVRMRFSLASGGAATAAGVLVIDDLSVAVHPLPSTVLTGNFFPNPTFEQGVQLDNPTLGIPSGGWSHGGSSPSMDQVITNNWVSPTHALALFDNDRNNYGEWYLSPTLDLTGLVSANDAVDIQWFQIYSVTNGSMRLSVAFLDSKGNQLISRDFNTGASGKSSGWNGSVAASSFERQFQRLLVPAGAKQLRFNFASGGASSVTGVMVIDDLSVRVSTPDFTDVTLQPGVGVDLTWNAVPTKTYTVLFSPTLSPTPSWSPLATNISGVFPTTDYLDTDSHGGANQGFYRIRQE